MPLALVDLGGEQRFQIPEMRVERAVGEAARTDPFLANSPPT